MYSTLPNFILGFHGCDEAIGEDLLSGKKDFVRSMNEYDWLGNGIYFWENNPDRAISWAKEQAERHKKNMKIPIEKRITKPFAVGAVIDLGRCLNLFDQKALEEVKVAHAVLTLASMYAHAPMPTNHSLSQAGDLLLRNLDKAVMDTLMSQRTLEGKPAYDSVRAMFQEGESLYENAGFKAQNHIQIAVRNPNCIKGVFRIKQSDSHYPIP